jgi:hypothetical protein
VILADPAAPRIRPRFVSSRLTAPTVLPVERYNIKSIDALSDAVEKLVEHIDERRGTRVDPLITMRVEWRERWPSAS